MTACKDHAANLETLRRVFADGAAALMECKRKDNGMVVAMLCAVYKDEEGRFNFVPFAEMVSGNPYEDYFPPNPDGGFSEDDDAKDNDG